MTTRFAVVGMSASWSNNQGDPIRVPPPELCESPMTRNPGQPHAYGPMAPYAFQLQAEYFAEFLLGDRSFRMSADFGAHPPQ